MVHTLRHRHDRTLSAADWHQHPNFYAWNRTGMSMNDSQSPIRNSTRGSSQKFSSSVRQQCWERAEEVAGRDPDRYVTMPSINWLASILVWLFIRTEIVRNVEWGNMACSMWPVSPGRASCSHSSVLEPACNWLHFHRNWSGPNDISCGTPQNLSLTKGLFSLCCWLKDAAADSHLNPQLACRSWLADQMAAGWAGEPRPAEVWCLQRPSLLSLPSHRAYNEGWHRRARQLPSAAGTCVVPCVTVTTMWPARQSGNASLKLCVCMFTKSMTLCSGNWLYHLLQCMKSNSSCGMRNTCYFCIIDTLQT